MVSKCTCYLTNRPSNTCNCSFRKDNRHLLLLVFLHSIHLPFFDLFSRRFVNFWWISSELFLFCECVKIYSTQSVFIVAFNSKFWLVCSITLPALSYSMRGLLLRTVWIVSHDSDKLTDCLPKFCLFVLDNSSIINSFNICYQTGLYLVTLSQF